MPLVFQSSSFFCQALKHFFHNKHSSLLLLTQLNYEKRVKPPVDLMQLVFQGNLHILPSIETFFHNKHSSLLLLRQLES
jgi:hypothetical protein